MAKKQVLCCALEIDGEMRARHVPAPIDESLVSFVVEFTGMPRSEVDTALAEGKKFCMVIFDPMDPESEPQPMFVWAEYVTIQ